MSCKNTRGAGVTAYLAGAGTMARPILESLHHLVQEAGPSLEAVIRWGSPCYKGRSLVCWLGAFKDHVSLTFFQGHRLRDPQRLLQHGRGNAASRTAKFRAVGEVPRAAVRALVRQAVRLDAEGEAGKQARPRRAELPVPEDLQNRLSRSANAQAFFDRLPPSCRREYVEWILTAKRPETRARRLAATLSRLQAGRRQNEPDDPKGA